MVASQAFLREAAFRLAVWKEAHPDDTQPLGKAENEESTEPE